MRSRFGIGWALCCHSCRPSGHFTFILPHTGFEYICLSVSPWFWTVVAPVGKRVDEEVSEGSQCKPAVNPTQPLVDLPVQLAMHPVNGAPQVGGVCLYPYSMLMPCIMH